MTPEARGPRPTFAERSPAPDWRGDPLSWDKLDRIEAWLDSDATWDWPELVPEAVLELAEGRLQLAQEERAGLPPAVLEQRLRASEAGFRRVLDEDSASDYQRGRAEKGLAQVTGLLPTVRPEAEPPRTAFAILPRSAWGAAPPAITRLTPNRRQYTRITVHHSALPAASLRTVGEAAEEIKDIQTVHMRDKNFGDIGYHFVIDPAGRIYAGRDLKWQGAHAGGDDGVNNIANIGICLLGDFDHERPDPRALRALEQLIDALCERHGIAHNRVKGHQDYKATQCPGTHLESWVRRYSSQSVRHAGA